MYPSEKFDLIVKLEENKIPPEFRENMVLEKLESELKTNNSHFYIKESEFYNVFMVELKEDKLKTALKLANSSLNNLEMIPIECVVITRPEKILKKIINISKNKIKDGETFTVRCNTRGERYIKKKEEFINSIYKELRKLDGKPDQNHPDWIIHIEVLGENTGISVLKQNFNY